MGQEIECLAQFAVQSRWEDIPGAVAQHAKLVLLDSIGVILAGSIRPEVAALRMRLAANSGSGATILGPGASTTDIRTAALMNGIAGRAVELCEGLRLASGQVAIQVLPGMLAVGEDVRANGKTLLTTLITSYEIAARLGLAFKPRELAHQNGQAMLIAAAAAGALMRSFDPANVSLTMRIAAILMLTPSYTNTGAGATALNVAGGMAGFAGAIAPDLALAGFEAKPDAIEEALGKMVGAGFDPTHLTDALGERWEITRNYFRLHACCNPIHPALDALQDAIRQLQARAEDIERIEFATYKFASVMSHPEPINFFASKYSLPHAAAVMAVRGDTGHRAIDEEALRDAAVAAIRARVSVHEDPSMTARVPKDKPARVTLTLKDGRQCVQERSSHRGDFNEPYSEAQLRAKFHDLAGDVLSSQGIDLLERAIDHCEQLQSVGELADIVRKNQKLG